MSNKRTTTRAPKLRFPEFRDAGEWEEKPFGETATFTKGKGISKADISVGGSQPCIRYGELYTHYSETIDSVISYTDLPPDELVLSRANDVIIPASGETQIDIATASCVLKSGIALGGDLNIIRSKMNGVFLSYYLNNAKRKAIAEVAQGISVVHLYSSQLKTLKINIPEIAEQRKIAECLTSLDELIAAHGQKLDALKAHKKGLLQHLFPAEGETVPRLRFPEFRNTGEWEEKKLGEICERITEKVGDTSLVPVSITAGYGFVSQESKFGRDISGAQYKNYTFLRYGDFAYNKGNSKKYPQGYVCQLKEFGQAAASTAFICFRLKNEYEADFIQGLFDKNTHGKQLAKHITSSARSDGLLNINPQDFFNIILPIPSLPEQRKIAECLTSLDEQIAAQSQKIDALNAHKKGLLQQLFPSPEEV